MRVLQLSLALTVLAWVLAWQATRRLPELAAISPQLLAEPRQRDTGKPNFQFEYRGIGYEVKPMATYELYGLVVSHNDILGISDMYHDKDSLDTKDLCVVWGDNVTREDYRLAKYESTAHFCWAFWPAGTTLDMTKMSNSHLITDRDDLRKSLDGVHIGDQIHFKGWLVAYRDLRHPDYWRTSSMVRTDQGNGACEVVFFDELDVLARNAPRAHVLKRQLPFLAGLLTLAIVIVAVATDPRVRA